MKNGQVLFYGMVKMNLVRQKLTFRVFIPYSRRTTYGRITKIMSLNKILIAQCFSAG